MTSDHKSGATAKPAKTFHLIPPELEHLIADRPLTFGEDPHQYDLLLASIFADLDPKGTMEAVLAKDIVDCIWEARRVKRIRAAATAGEWTEEAWNLMGASYGSGNILTPGSEIKEAFAKMIRGALLGITKDAEEAHKLALATNVRPEMIEYGAHKSGLAHISALNAELERLERRRDRLLKHYTERRAALTAMAKNLVARETAEQGIVQGGAHAT